MAGSFPSFSINDGDWIRVRQFIQKVSTFDLQGGGNLVPYSGAVGNITLGTHNLATTGALNSWTHVLGCVGTSPYPLFIKAISGVNYSVYIKDANNYSRVIIESLGAQSWNLNSGAVESGRIVHTTPGGTKCGILLYAYDHTTGTTFYYRNTFGLTHQDTTFGIGYSDDGYATIAIHKGSKCQINWGNRDIDFQVSGDTDTNLFYCDAGNDRVGVGTATPAVTFDILGTSRFGDSATNYAQFAADGELTLTGTAKVKKRIMIPLAAVKLGAVDPPSEGVIDGFMTLDFDGGTKDEEVFKPFCGPLDWASGTGCTLNLRFFVDTAPASAANVVWQIEVKSIACEGIVDFSSGTSTYIDTVAITTGTPANDKKVHCSELTIPAGDLIAGGCLFIRLHRDATHASDTFTGDARLLKTFITYTADKLGQAT